jgi:TonB-dependent SusC/RagA subfamily outer membrane receptor
MLNWYNPFVWLIRRSIRQNLEFIADHQVLEAGLDRKQYQYLLLKVVGAPAFAIANQFNFSSLKKRIAMMNKMRSAKVHLIKFMFVLPLLTILLLAFRNAAINSHAEKASPENELAGSGMDSSISISITDTVPLMGKVRGVRIDSTRSLTIVVRNDSSRLLMDASLNGPGNPYRMPPANVLYVIDGVEQPQREDVLKTLDPSDIESVTVLKDKSAVTTYGEKGKDGVILITTKMGVKLQPPPVAPSPSVKDTIPVRPVTRMRVDGNEVRIGGGKFKGVIVVDGEVYDSIRYQQIDLKPDDIERIDVLKGPAAESEYGVKGSTHGVIKITTKIRDNKITVTDVPAGRRKSYTEAEAKALYEDAQVNNILFVGVENRLPLTIKGVPEKELVVTMDRGHVTMKENVAYIKPTSPGKAELTIARKRGFNSPLEVLERRTLTIKFLPPPGSFGTRRQLITQAPAQVEGKPFVVDASLRLEEPF